MSRYTYDEITYLRLYVYGYEESDFLNFFSLDTDKLERIILGIQHKFRLKGFRRIIQLAFELGILSPKDFIEDSIKKVTSEFSFKIFQQLKAVGVNVLKNRLQEDIEKYLHCCNHELEFNRAINNLKQKHMRITLKEKALIEMIYLGMGDDKKIGRALNVSVKEVVQMKHNVLKSLEANSWYNAIRRAFQLNILDKQKYATLNLESEIEACAERILEIKSQGKQCGLHDLEIQLQFYEEFINLYNTVEYDYLLRNDLQEFRSTLADSIKSKTYRQKSL